MTGLNLREMTIPEQHAEVLERILDDMMLRLDALAARAGMPEVVVIQTAIVALSLVVLGRGTCRTVLLKNIETNLEGQCPCERETEGSA